MLNLVEVIAQTKKFCPIFGKRVAGATEFDKLSDTNNQPMPAAFVVADGEEASPNTSQTDYRQFTTFNFMVYVIVAQLDENGKVGYQRLPAIRKELLAALVGWYPPSGDDIIKYAGSKLDKMNQHFLGYRFNFLTPLIVDEAQTWLAHKQRESLTGIDLTLTAKETGEKQTKITTHKGGIK